MRSRAIKVLLVLLLGFSATGCTFIFQKGRRSDAMKIEELSQQLSELERTKRQLQLSLADEIDNKQVSLDMMEKGLVVTVVGDLLFDSGQAKIRSEGYTILGKVADVLKEDVPNNRVGIEGHTDNQPIKHSPWKTNWRLSTERALSVLDHMVKKEGVAPERLSAIGYGEYQPISYNDTKEGRQLNRRVEIVILPELTKSNALGEEVIK
ncbi:MAG: OmpA family protein [Candidatus Omnitrophota bacterium]